MKNGRLVPYLPWLVRDYFLWGGVTTYVVLFGFGWLFWQGFAANMARVNDPENTARGIRAIASTLTMMVAALGPLVAMLSSVSIDRMQGYYRFLFSRPVSPPAYYTLKLAINGVGFLIVAAGLWATFRIAISPLDVPRFLPVMALSYLLIGGVVFLTSVLTRLDLLVSLLLYIVSGVAWGTLAGNPDGVPAVVKPLIWMLPPVHKHAAMVNSIFRPDAAIVWKEVVWVGGYGLACFAIGILILRRRGLAE